jgi:Family of unknown function (DUF5996)
MNTEANWPSLDSQAWRDTYPTLHMWSQIVGKICLALTPRTNHFWNVAMQVTARGLATPLMPYRDRGLTITFDFVSHQLIFQSSDGSMETISLQPRTVADFYALVMSTLKGMKVDVRIWPMPVEIPNPIRFESDVTHHSYDPDAANAFWRILISIKPILEQFRCEFLGKCSPVHFFWGSFDLAVTRFSGRRAPDRPGADPITQESYSHEVISHGFWPGSGAIPYPAFYAYAAPEPAGLKSATIQPPAAFYSTDFSEFVLPYESVRMSKSRESDLKSFLATTYDSAANLAQWNRSEIERS